METACAPEQQDTKVKSRLYIVPVDLIELQQCSEGRPLQGSRLVHWLIEAKSSQEAVLNLAEEPGYWKNYNLLPVEARKHLRPFRINLKDEIERIPSCENRHKTKGGDYVCGPPMTEMEYDPAGINGEFGDCLCQSFWAHSPEELRTNCPYKNSRKF